jgi:hypothetical protein
LSGRGLCDELITRLVESCRLCCVVVCDLETSRIDAPYIYDISHLRVKAKSEADLMFFSCVVCLGLYGFIISLICVTYHIKLTPNVFLIFLMYIIYHMKITPNVFQFFLICATWHIQLTPNVFLIFLICATWHIQLMFCAYLIVYMFATWQLKLIHFGWITLR